MVKFRDGLEGPISNQLMLAALSQVNRTSSVAKALASLG